MEFFNKKEEVIDLQLTQYGKFKLSTGKFKPVYYAFHDENIIYDSDYAGFSETQNETHPRIQENTPNTKIIHNFHSIEDDMVRAVEIQNSENPDLAQAMLQQTADKSQVLVNPLANSDLGTNKIPSWNLSVLSGKMLTGSTTPTLTLSSSATILNIPQIEIEMIYRVEVATGDPLTEQEAAETALEGGDGIPQALKDMLLNPDQIIDAYGTPPFTDGSYFKVDGDPANGKLLFQIVEENVPQGNDNFEIEIFEIEDVDANGVVQNTTKLTDLKQLRLLVEPELIINDILTDEADGNSLSSSDIDSSFADYFFEILTDSEISPAFVCNLIGSGDEDTYKFARKDFVCPDMQQEYQIVNPYSQKDSDACGDT